MESGYGEEAHDGVLPSHPGVHVNGGPLPEQKGPDQSHMQNLHDALNREFKRLDERISLVHASVWDEIRGLHENFEVVDVQYGPGGKQRNMMLG